MACLKNYLRQFLFMKSLNNFRKVEVNTINYVTLHAFLNKIFRFVKMGCLGKREVRKTVFCHTYNNVENIHINQARKLLVNAFEINAMFYSMIKLSRKHIRNTSHINIFTKLEHQNLSSYALHTTIQHFSTVSSLNVNKNDNLMNLEKQYCAPKSILHNAYNIIAQELGNKDFQLRPTYNIVKNKSSNAWSCTYNIKWPENLKFTSIGPTKKDASYKAAICALGWLQKNNKLTKDGYPIVVDNKSYKEIMKQTQPKLALDQITMDEMHAISTIYENEFEPLIENKQSNTERQDQYSVEVEDPSLDAPTAKKKVYSLSKYLIKEETALPISKFKEEFINLLKGNRIVIIKGEPGCGKSTRIPQYVLEAWAKENFNKQVPCQIAVTQPRRLAAISLANRVSDERGERCGHVAGYQIRLNSNFNQHSGRILYCTTGILLNYLQKDMNLTDFTYIILDEAHERDVNTDLLMNLLKKTMKANHNLKLIVMSATVDTGLFRDYFNGAPIMDIPGFVYPVKSYFLDDLNNLDLSKTYRISSVENQNPSVVHEDVVKVISYIHNTKSEGAILCFLPGWEDIVKIEKLIPVTSDMTVLCLHSRLQDEDQRKIFYKTPPGVRKVILSTNIAETSVTIDDVVYVIDSGIHKESRFDHEKSVNCIDNYWISKSSMQQRKGRAGRVQPGKCFHLYTRSKYESFRQYSDPEILKTSLTKIILNSKVYSKNMDAFEFMSQLPSPPEERAIRRAVKELKDLKLLDEAENLTSLGRTLANFQLEPKLAKILVNAVIYKCLTPVVDIVTIFSGDTELFRTGLVDKQTVKNIKSEGSEHSDHLALMRLFETWLELMEQSSTKTAERYCNDANLVHHKLLTMKKLRQVHFEYLYNGLYQILPLSDNYSDNEELVKAILYSGVGNLLRHRNWDIVKGRCKKRNVFLTNNNQRASITSESVNFKKTSLPSDCLVYFNEIRSNLRKTTLIRECSVLTPSAVLLLSDKNLVIKELESNGSKVLLTVNNTKIEYICSKQEADQILRCKNALNAAYWYFIYQMTEGGERCLEVNKCWDKILEHLNSMLKKHDVHRNCLQNNQ